MIRKFHDLDRDGEHDLGEPMLAGIPFDIAELDGGAVHHRITDAEGTIRICFTTRRDEGKRVEIRELPGQTGGQWTLTTTLPGPIGLACGDTTVWVGNVRIGVPETGLGGGRRR